MELNRFRTRPKAAPIDVSAYLDLLCVMKELPSLNYLRKIHRNHLKKIPFENLDIHLKVPISLDVKKIFQKIKNGKRGGLCFELNLTFYHFLMHLGYDTHLISARVWNEKTKKYGPEYDHMAMLVKIQNDIYLCDVGYGDGFLSPIKMKSSQPQLDFNRFYQVERDPDSNFILQVSEDGQNFQPVYIFAPKFREPIEFIDRCDFVQKSDQSPFVKKKVISIFTDLGFIKLTDQKLIIRERGKTNTSEVMNEDAFYAKMEEHFGINRLLLHNLE